MTIPPFRPVSLAKSAVLGAAFSTGLQAGHTIGKHKALNKQAEKNRANGLNPQDYTPKAASALEIFDKSRKSLLKGVGGGLFGGFVLNKFGGPIINKLATRALKTKRPK